MSIPPDKDLKSELRVVSRSDSPKEPPTYSEIYMAFGKYNVAVQTILDALGEDPTRLSDKQRIAYDDLCVAVQEFRSLNL